MKVNWKRKKTGKKELDKKPNVIISDICQPNKVAFGLLPKGLIQFFSAGALVPV